MKKGGRIPRYTFLRSVKKNKPAKAPTRAKTLAVSWPEVENATGYRVYRAPVEEKASARKAAKRKRDAARAAARFARTFHSEARVRFVQSLPCVACRRAPSVNAHTETGGTSRRADYTTIVPACDPHHREMHGGIASFATRYGLDLRALAAATEVRWQAFAETTGAT